MRPHKEKSRILLVLHYLLEKTDTDHDVSSKDIMRMLCENGLLTSDNRTIEQDIDLLIAAGYDIVKNHRNGVPPRYKVVSRGFDTVELKILIDAVVASRFIQPDRSRQLIQNLANLAGPSARAGLSAKAENLPAIKQALGGTMYVADALYRAIIAKQKVSYQMIDFRVPDKQPVLHRGGYVYTVSPYAMIWSNDRYYLLAYEESRRAILTPRVDHITNVSILEDDIIPAPKDFDIGYYYSSSYKIYDGPEQEITLLCRNQLLVKLIDRFGMDFECIPVSEDIFQATATASIGPTFFGWLFQYAGDMELVAPESVVKQYKKQRQRAASGRLSKEARNHHLLYSQEDSEDVEPSLPVWDENRSNISLVEDTSPTVSTE